jgi:hypothetical protein
MTAAVRKLVLIVAAMALGLATLAPSAGAGGGQKVDVKFEELKGFNAPGTPAKYNKVGILKTGPSDAKNILVLVPGTSASAAIFRAAGEDIVRKSKGWQVWAVERRENFLRTTRSSTRPRREGHPEADVRLLPRLRDRPDHHEALSVHPGRRHRVA